jgi:ATP phosphoribosyltransferase regulatory subunit
MSVRPLLQAPPGVQCFTGDEARRRRAIEAACVAVFEGWDYEEIIPPLYDFAEVFASEALTPKTYSFVGRDGSLLALRPDFTSLLAKIAASRLAERAAPIRLYYSGEVFRYEPPKAGRQSELHQMGLEHLGGERTADVEVLAVAAECLARLGVEGFILALGHVGVFAGLVAGSTIASPELAALRERVEAKDHAGVRSILERAGVAQTASDAIVSLTTLGGGPDDYRRARAAFGFCPAALRALDELDELVGALVEAGLGGHLTIDLAQVRGLDYYTGLVFRAYAPGLGFDVGAGGRYDTLLARFGRPMPAVGFMLGLDRVALLPGWSTAARPAEAEPIAGAIGEALRTARERRAAGARVRLRSGE